MIRQTTGEVGTLAGFLADAGETPVSPAALAASWRMARVAVTCLGEGRLVAIPNTAAKIRGAWGRALAQAASADALRGGPCGWDPPCAYDLFFNNQGRLTARLEIPKPFVLALDRADDDLRVTLTLFGVAGNWAGEATDALVQALRNGLDTGATRRPLEVAARTVSGVEGIPVPDLSAGAVLRFLSPMALRSGQNEHIRPASLITGLANRVGGLARWQGVRLDIDPTQLKVEAEQAGARAKWLNVESWRWQRGSRAQGRMYSVAGVTGELQLPGVSPEVSALLAIGAETHAGSRPALGMGRYVLVTHAN